MNVFNELYDKWGGRLDEILQYMGPHSCIVWSLSSKRGLEDIQKYLQSIRNKCTTFLGITESKSKYTIKNTKYNPRLYLNISNIIQNNLKQFMS